MSKKIRNESYPSFWATLKVILQTALQRHFWIVVALLTFSIVSALLQTWGPTVFQQTVDLITKGPFDQNQFIILVILGAIALLGAAVTKNISDRISFYLATQVEDHYRITGLQHFYDLPLTWHNQNDSGEIAAKMDRGSSAIYTIIHEVFGQNFIVPSLTLVMVLIYAAISFPAYAWILILPVPIYVITTYLLSQQLAKQQEVINNTYHEANRTWHDGVGNLRYVKAFGKETYESQTYEEKWRNFHGLEYESEKIWLKQGVQQKVIETVMRLGLLYLAGMAVLNQELTIGQLLLLMSFQQLAFAPLQQLSGLFTRIRRVTGRASNLFGILEEKNELHGQSTDKLEPLREKIEIKKLHFHYGKMTALNGINLTIRAGELTALVGKSGAGKTTLANLLLRFYQPSSGKILWDKKDLATVNRQSLRDRTALVLQDTTLFNRSIRDNIAYANLKASKKEVEHAAKLAHCHEFILKLPKGYQSIVGERGVKLSGGQRQRVAIARALLAKADLLVMDEATSHLDSETEKAIQEAIQYLHGKKTQVIIAHRLSTIQHADNIVVMDKGKVIAQGTHTQLLKKNKIYQKLCKLQFGKKRNGKKE